MTTRRRRPTPTQRLVRFQDEMQEGRGEQPPRDSRTAHERVEARLDAAWRKMPRHLREDLLQAARAATVQAPGEGRTAGDERVVDPEALARFKALAALLPSPMFLLVDEALCDHWQEVRAGRKRHRVDEEKREEPGDSAGGEAREEEPGEDDAGNGDDDPSPH